MDSRELAGWIAFFMLEDEKPEETKQDLQAKFKAIVSQQKIKNVQHG